jgi:hypothetical protein
MVTVREEQVLQSPSGGMNLLWNFISSILLLFSVDSVSKFFFGAKKEKVEEQDAIVPAVEKPRNGVKVPPPKAFQNFGPSRQYIPRNQGNYGHTKRIKP